MLVVAMPTPAMDVDIMGRHDRPATVNVSVQAKDSGGTVLQTTVVSWGLDDNTFGIQSLSVPPATQILRFTFDNDSYICCDPDDDRNAFFDFFAVDGIQREAEDYDLTGGTDASFPGCDPLTIDGRLTMVCGNRNDFVEYVLGNLSITVRNDIPGPVNISLEGEDSTGSPFPQTVLSWGADNNTFGTRFADVPPDTARLRLTFINDSYICCDPDMDRNAFIDSFNLAGLHQEAENFDATGGTDVRFPGCGVQNVDGRTVADCGNRNDYVEYLFGPFWKQAYPNYAPSGVPDIDQRQANWGTSIMCGPNGFVDTLAAGDDSDIFPSL